MVLTLTERMTRKEIIRKMPKKNVNSVHKVLNQLKRESPQFQLDHLKVLQQTMVLNLQNCIDGEGVQGFLYSMHIHIVPGKEG